MRRITFKDFCMDNNFEFLLDLWDYDLNEDLTPDKITQGSNDRIYFKCPKGLHESSSTILNTITRAYRDNGTYKLCKKCNSIGQYIIDNYGEDYLHEIWSEQNTQHYFDISSGGNTKFFIKCLEDPTHPDYDINGYNFKVSHKCPYCLGQRLCETNSLGYRHPEVIDLWSDKNDTTPFDYTVNSGKYVWFKCQDGIHEDYRRKIDDATNLNYVCGKCGLNNKHILKGEEHPNWKGGLKTEAETIRQSRAYARWRKKALEKCNYVCQCCGTYGGDLEVHHIYDFANYKNLRMDDENAIVFCKSCHSNTIKGSLHSIYGTNNGVTPEQLEEYINNKRNQLGINIPFSIDEYKRGNILKPGDITTSLWIFDIFAPSELKSEPKKQSNFVKIKPKYRI